MEMPTSKEVHTSGIAGSSHVSSIWSLPNLPITEQFGIFDANFPTFDQELMVCMESGHFQLKNSINPKYLYQNATYSFHTLPSQKIKDELKFLIENLEIDKNVSDTTRILEIGGNNYELANLLSTKVANYIICDPILSDYEDYKSNVLSWGGMIEDHLDRVREYKPTLIVGRHVLEHIVDPFETLLKLVEIVPDGTLFYFETPSLGQILSKLRFDAIFHQHLHYYDESSIAFLVQKLNCELIKILTNPLGSNGGSLLFSFKKSTKSSIFVKPVYQSVEAKVSYFSNQLSTFQKVIESQVSILDTWTEEKFGYGAGLMLATYNYHLGGKIESLKGILDDDNSKTGFTYKNIDIKIYNSTTVSESASTLMLITSLENQLAIRNRIGRVKNWVSLGYPIF